MPKGILFFLVGFYAGSVSGYPFGARAQSRWLKKAALVSNDK